MNRDGMLQRGRGAADVMANRWMRCVVVGLVSSALVVAAFSSCKQRPRDELAQQIAAELTAKPSEALPPLTITDDTPDLSLTWVDAQGDTKEGHKPADVPPEARDQVRVYVHTREEGTGDRFYVANLTVKNDDGAYATTTMTRAQWEDLLGKRREAFLKQRNAASSPPPGTPSPDDSSAPSGNAEAAHATVIVYGASWCEACRQVMAHLKRRRVPAIEKDIERDPTAESEMRDKLAKAGIRSGSIPIIDVKGRILVGFEPHALDEAIAKIATIPL